MRVYKLSTYGVTNWMNLDHEHGRFYVRDIFTVQCARICGLILFNYV